MERRARAIVKTLGVCLTAGTVVAAVKLAYGTSAHSLAFMADGIHVLFDSGATVLGMISVLFSSKPPDQDHPYGHRKFEAVSALVLGLLLLFAAYEVGVTAWAKLSGPVEYPDFSFLGVAILVAAAGVSLSISRLELKMARELSSQYLAADAVHNSSDVWVTLGVLVSLLSVHLHIPRMDSVVSLGIAVYLVYMSVHLMLINIKPLVDSSVLDPNHVAEIAAATDGVLQCHNVRSRGEKGHHFLDLNIHLPGHISLWRAHEITHNVEARLKAEFPGLVDVVIHTEPEGHPPCSE